ncbi:TrmB family transcriptional regulator [Jatrophihabitans lederbergiae]|uniref:Helix-turn-helix domain-containing protein n=1 Tax=Jatrophihabitans lederbergiae TaxID=3075547 RepID=A0ABU2J4Q9_9ACTN|nr:helix-turn-helix domain-containing protein [Jatrophihabitans sp. DSM 44399]MDT0259967.1 helix-turn-helix domain-containing protein [Jatrophihabitans sp. DSM 44399]
MAGLNSHVHGLVELGMTRYEAKAYLTLIQRESYAASELASEAGIPRQRIYDVLNSLVSRGLARDWPGPVTRYAATDPETAIDRLLAVQRQALSGLESHSADLASDLRATWVVGREENAPLDYVEVLRNAGMLGARFRELQHEAERELLTFAKAPYAMTENRVGLAATRRIADSGGDVRCVYEYSVLDDAEVVAETLEFIAAGEGARVAADVPMKLCLADGHRALFSLTDPIAGGLTSTNILVEHASLTTSLRFTFEALWANAEPFEQALENRLQSSA